MAARLTINIERVRDRSRKYSLDGRHKLGLPVFVVDGFGDFQHDPRCVTSCGLRDWPTVWAVALIEGDDDYTLRYHFHASCESREDALAEARRTCGRSTVRGLRDRIYEGDGRIGVIVVVVVVV